MGRLIVRDGRRNLGLSTSLFLFFATACAMPLMAQGPSQWPVPVVTPTPSPTPPEAEPQPPPETGAVPEDTSTPKAAEAESGEPSDEAPKGEEEINPGDVAFTDYSPFDLDQIEPQPFQSKWKGFVAGVRGLTRFSLLKGNLKFRIGGKGQLDGTTGQGNSTYEEFYPAIGNDFSLRRLTAYAAGRLYKFNFNVEFEFGPDWGISDAWIEGAEGGLEVWGKYLGRLRLGMMNEPFSLERQTSGFNLGLMERSLPVQTLAPGSNIGAMVHDSGPKGRFTWAFGMFSFGQKNDANASVSALSLTGRVTFTPINRDNGRNILHFGVSLSSRNPIGGTLQYRSRPEARFVSYLVDTGSLSTAHARLLGLEFAEIRGPVWLAAEYVRSDLSADVLDNPSFGGTYIQVGWFLTGESKPYRGNSGTFDRLRPRLKYSGGNPFKKKNGGAWEVVGRLSTINLSDGLVDGGKLTDFSAALGWYLNATTKVEIDYIHAMPRDHGSANIALLRLQYNPW